MAASDPLPGTPTERAPDVLECGDGDCGAVFLSLSARHAGGQDAQYLHWHTLDHRPEQQRLTGLRASLRAISTPACRAARSAGSPHYEPADHVMVYFFARDASLEGFGRLSAALRGAGRSSFTLDPVQRDLYDVQEKLAAPGVTAGADVLPWVPCRGIYLLLGSGESDPGVGTALADVAGVAGIWTARQRESSFGTGTGSGTGGQILRLCFLDDDPVAVAARLRPLVQDLWRPGGALLAAPFYCVVPYEWDRYLP